MPWSPPPPPPPQQATAGDAGMLETLERQALHFPELAFSQAERLRRPDQRESVLRLAFLTAAARQPEIAVRHLDAVVDRPWIGETPLHDAIRVAAAAQASHPDAARRLLTTSALRNPSLAFREFERYARLPFGPAVFDAVAVAAADEVVPVAAGTSPLALSLRRALSNSGRGEVRMLALIAERENLEMPARARLATLARPIAAGALSMEQAERVVSSPASYFAELIRHRLAAPAAAARDWDRVLENYALTLCRGFQESPGSAAADLARFTARDLYLLLGYGRAEQEDVFFSGIFDRLLLPKLEALRGPAPLMRLVEETRAIRFRAFASAAILFNRWDTLLRLEGGEPARAALIARLVKGVAASERPLEDAVTLSEILELTSSPERLRLLARVIAEERGRAVEAPARALFEALEGRIQQRLGADSGGGPGGRQAGLTEGAGSLAASAVFDAAGAGRQRHFFYYDQDGVDSFQTFLMAYGNDPAWKVELKGGVARVSGEGRGRRILIFANEPFDLLDPANAGREEEAARRDEAVAAMLRESGGEARVLVHRGHSYHVDKTLRRVTRATAFVYLGSCRGLDKVAPVLEIANGAHVLATRGAGTKTINDPLLKDLNDQLLRADRVDWAAFWRRQEARLGRRPHFRDYLPPHRNPVSLFLRAYYRALAE